MPRQRLRTRTSPLAFVGKLLLVLFALALVWYGAMMVLLGLKVSPDDVNSISGIRAISEFLGGLSAGRLDGAARIIGVAGGLLALALFGFLAYKEIPRPYLARQELRLADDDRGELSVGARAVERAAEAAASGHPAVSGVTGRYGDDDLRLDVRVQRPRDVAETLGEVQRRAREALERHELPETPVDVILSGFDRHDERSQ